MNLIIFIWLIPICFCDKSPNFVIILTDDQDVVLDSMVRMNRTIDLIGNNGATFTNAYANAPICCPSRSTLLTGKYLHNIHVKNNSISGNCSSLSWQKNYEPSAIANILKMNNYKTFYAGKYLNQYGSEEAGGPRHVPPGYDWWIGLVGNSKYYNYTLSINGTAKYFDDTYLTDLIRDYALEFLNQNYIKSDPFFMILSTPAAHDPFTPAPRHKGFYSDLKAPRTISFNFSATDKHWIVTKSPKHLPTNVSSLDDIYHSRLETLLSVDEMVEDIYKKLSDLNVLQNTYLIFTSDNGFHIGQFTQPWDKRQPYETDIKVPLLIRGPNITKKTVEDLTSLVDLAPTIMELAKIKIPGDINGESFAKSLTDRKFTEQKKKYLFVEYHGEGELKYVDTGCPYSKDLAVCSLGNWCKCQDSVNNTYTCVKFSMENINFKYCRFYDDLEFREAYDLIKDPFEMINIYKRLNSDVLKHFEGVMDDYLRA